jgi:hypothetical protein
VEIIAHDGRHWRVEGHNVPGNAENPMVWEDISRKFRECGSVAATPLPDSTLAKAEDLAARLEQLADATELIRCLAS